MIEHDNGIPLVRKAIVRSGLALNINGCREIAQLFQHLLDVTQRQSVELALCAVNKQNFKFSSTQLLLSSWTLIHGLSVRSIYITGGQNLGIT